MLVVLAQLAAAVVTPSAKVVVVGAGPVCICAAKVAALRGFSTTCMVYPADCEQGPGLVNEGGDISGLPLSFMPIAGPDANEEQIAATAADAEGVIFAVDGTGAFGAPVIETFVKPGTALKRVSVMSRNLNGEGMGFFANAAKFAANKEVWNADEKAVEDYKAMEAAIATSASAAGAEYTVIRAGTLKGGGPGTTGEANDDRSGEPSFLTPAFYALGQQDVVNWRLLYDCAALSVNLVAGDMLPGPGFNAALTATERIGPGDSHRGAVATALVEALRSPDAGNRDFAVGAEEGRTFPTEAEWQAMFKKAAA